MEENRIYKRFHIISDMKHVLLFNLKQLNNLENESHLMKVEMKENSMYRQSYEKAQLKNDHMENELMICSLATRCLEDMERLMIETSSVIDMYRCLDKHQEEIKGLFSEHFSYLIEGISNLESLFLSELPQIKDLLETTKMFGEMLQDVLQFEIQFEVKKTSILCN